MDDHSLTLAERRLRKTWISRLDVLKTRKSQEEAKCAELKEHVNSIRLAKVHIMGDFDKVGPSIQAVIRVGACLTHHINLGRGCGCGLRVVMVLAGEGRAGCDKERNRRSQVPGARVCQAAFCASWAPVCARPHPAVHCTLVSHTRHGTTRCWHCAWQAIMAEITELEKQLERQVQAIMSSCLEFDATTDMAALGRNFLVRAPRIHRAVVVAPWCWSCHQRISSTGTQLARHARMQIRQRDQRKAEETERQKRLKHLAAVESAKTRSAWQVALDTAALRAHELRADEFRGYLDRVFAAADEHNIDSLLARYQRREGANFRAFCALNHMCADTEELLVVRRGNVGAVSQRLFRGWVGGWVHMLV